MSESKFAISVMGPPGSGKGTQAELLVEKLGAFYFITSIEGKKYIAAHDDPETKRQEERYKKGLLFESPWTLRVVQERTQSIFENGRGIVYDGSPRTLFEAEELVPFLTRLFGNECVMAVELSVSEAELKLRLSKRMVCSRNHSHIFINAGRHRIGDPCPEEDGGSLQKRDIDDPKVFEIRMDAFRNLTIPAIEFLRKKNMLIVINGEQPVEKVRQDIDKALAKRLGRKWPKR
ncbi:MAG: hypothetical protein A3C07_03520 [Candidatus Sungbacteria bacterium RIFCSPHIGHO2_02_FULL_47_11]|uniref:Adenylate kinase n=1 Tax=Candidatus Sungbacteria bacterium RIFCSPHIGHO2_02_FULL_47_11 TaxID=1802270 RepID=A0A1G2KLR3_9BACT|nr:MAG: hypothetical protein A3C07_03520 [Candidatus Sungbacteria bacterium RIFCSPHIGHO2_02_FULL_47_11]